MIGKSLFRLVTLCAAIILVAEVSETAAIDVPLKQLEVYKGEEIYLQCAVDDLGSNTVTWEKGSKKITSGVNTLIKDSRVTIQRPYNRDWNLSVDRAKSSDQGVYTCRVNSSPPQFGSVKVTVVEDN
ncbi:hemicentin-1-like [Ruditapes philippinarum]|uniref:hemicentin-1-like n=1 Tax=Ruditapes philippinarum TaxID=129788 RepID=UPI00295BAF1D|nr:hemicentin-1-like [Ruditapes philippinarum]